MADRKAHTERRDALLRTLLRTPPTPRTSPPVRKQAAKPLDAEGQKIADMIDRGDPDELAQFAKKIGGKPTARRKPT